MLSLKEDNGFAVFYPEDSENAILAEIGKKKEYIKISEMSLDERQFLNGLILRNKPKKLLELGVSAGGSSVVMLNAIKDSPDAKLYSVDYLPYWYKDQSKKVGHIVDRYPNLKDHWMLHSGGLALKFMDKIGNGIDFCFIDTMHTNPGEILDFLMILPYLKEDAIVVFHDVNLHTASKIFQWHLTNNLLISSIVGEKIIQGNFNEKNAWSKVAFSNIAAIKLTKDTRENLYGIFNLLTIRWQYMPNKEEQSDMIEHFSKYYNSFFINYLEEVFDHHNKTFFKYYGIKYRIKQFAKKIPLAYKIMDKMHSN